MGPIFCHYISVSYVDLERLLNTIFLEYWSQLRIRYCMKLSYKLPVRIFVLLLIYLISKSKCEYPVRLCKYLELSSPYSLLLKRQIPSFSGCINRFGYRQLHLFCSVVFNILENTASCRSKSWASSRKQFNRVTVNILMATVTL